MSSTAIAHTERQPIAVVKDHWGMDREKLDLLKRTIAHGTTDDEFALFMATAQRLGLDPFARQIFAVMRFDSRQGRKVMSCQVSVDGFRSIADKTGACDGQDGPYWCGADGVWRDVWLGDGPPSAAKVTVYRKGQARGYTGIASYASYVQTSGGGPNNMWSRLADAMLAKCAECLALRKAFPAQLGGVYSPEEMGQADSAPASDTARTHAAFTGPAQASNDGVPEREKITHDLLADIANTTRAEDVRALAPRFNAMAKGTKSREVVYLAITARMEQLEKEQADAPVDHDDGEPPF